MLKPRKIIEQMEKDSGYPATIISTAGSHWKIKFGKAVVCISLTPRDKNHGYYNNIARIKRKNKE